MQTELLDRKKWKTPVELAYEICQYLEIFHNQQRRHSKLGYLTPVDHERLHELWIDVVKRLWSEPEPFDYQGEYFTIQGAQSKPKPLQNSRPVLINAGNSPAGIDFSARHVDINFVGMGTFEMGQAAAEAVRAKASEYGRTISTMTYASVVCRDTEAEARRDYERIVEGIDWEAIDYMTSVIGVEVQSYGDAWPSVDVKGALYDVVT